MKIIAIAAALALTAAAGAASAQSTTTTTTVQQTTTTSGAKFTTDTPIETIAADPAGKAVLDKDFPGLTSHPAYDQFKGMSLKAVQPMSQGAISDEAIAKATTDLAAVK